MKNTWILGVFHIEARKLVATWTCAMEVRFLASGEILTTLDQDVFDGKTAREVKQTLAAHVGVCRFRQRLFTEDGFQEIHDDEVSDQLPCESNWLCWSSCHQMLKRKNIWLMHSEKRFSPCGKFSSRSSKSKPIRWAWVKTIYTLKSGRM